MAVKKKDPKLVAGLWLVFGPPVLVIVLFLVAELATALFISNVSELTYWLVMIISGVSGIAVLVWIPATIIGSILLLKVARQRKAIQREILLLAGPTIIGSLAAMVLLFVLLLTTRHIGQPEMDLNVWDSFFNNPYEPARMLVTYISLPVMTLSAVALIPCLIIGSLSLKNKELHV